MDGFKAVALVIAVLVALFALLTVRRQFQNLARLRREPHVASDERAFIHKQAWRRSINGAFLLILAGMIAGTYLSGMEDRANEIAARNDARHDAERADPAGPDQPRPTEEERNFTRFWVGYWITILIFVFLIFSMAILDIWATRRYAYQQLKRLRDDHRTLLERDLAVYRQQRANERIHRRG